MTGPTNADRDSESFERNATANESTAASNAEANQRTAAATERQADIEQIESRDRMERAARKEVRTDRVEDRDEALNQFRRRLVYIGPFAFLFIVCVVVFTYAHQTEVENDKFIAEFCSNVEKYHKDEGERRQLTYEFVLREFEESSAALEPAVRAERLDQIERAYKPIPNDPDCTTE